MSQPPDHYTFQVFVTGTLSSLRAVQDLRALCEAALIADPCIDVINVHENPQLAEEARIIATPTVVRVAPAPRKKVLGDLSDRVLAARALGLRFPPPAEEGQGR